MSVLSMMIDCTIAHAHYSNEQVMFLTALHSTVKSSRCSTAQQAVRTLIMFTHPAS